MLLMRYESNKLYSEFTLRRSSLSSAFVSGPDRQIELGFRLGTRHDSTCTYVAVSLYLRSGYIPRAEF
jgi:hypothetical protein